MQKEFCWKSKWTMRWVNFQLDANNNQEGFSQNFCHFLRVSRPWVKLIKNLCSLNKFSIFLIPQKINFSIFSRQFWSIHALQLIAVPMLSVKLSILKLSADVWWILRKTRLDNVVRIIWDLNQDLCSFSFCGTDYNF
mgnify:CR=1 FL=1